MKRSVKYLVTGSCTMLTAAFLATSCASPNTGAETGNTAETATEAGVTTTATAETTAAETTEASEAGVTTTTAAETTAAETTEASEAAETTAAEETESTESGTAKAETTAAETTKETENAAAETTAEAETTAAETEPAEASETAAAPAEAVSGYNFVGGGITITMGAEAAPILAALGEPTDVFEQDSCAYQGKDRVYTYPGFEISTYPADDTECVSSVYVLDDSVATAEGIRIGSTSEEVKKAYEGQYTEEFGVYRVNDGKTELNIYTTGDVVDGIEYLVVPGDN